VRTRALPGQVHAERFAKVEQMIGRLNHTIKAVKVLMEAVKRLPYQYFGGVTVERISSPHIEPLSLDENLTIHSILNGIIRRTANPTLHREEYDDSLAALEGSEGRLSKKFENELDRRQNWSPTVHAELVLLEYVCTSDVTFLDDDRYIGCSKPACYWCHNYMEAHLGKCTLYATHHNAYVNWWAPIFPQTYRDGFNFPNKTRDEILNNLIGDIGREVLDNLWRREGPQIQRRRDSLLEMPPSSLDVLQATATPPTIPTNHRRCLWRVNRHT